MGDPTDRILAFLTAIGIEIESELEVARGEELGSEFLPGVAIRGGRLRVDRGRLTWPGDLLHEAGHIAVTPAALRSSLSGELATAAPHAGEIEATAWAYAAVVALGLDARVLFHEGGYRGHSEGLVRTYSLGVYPGAAGLVAAGMARGRGEAGEPYPAMVRWLRA
jgi:hypothetical protein